MIKLVLPDAKLVSDKNLIKRSLRQAGREVINTAKGLIQKSAEPSKPGDPPASKTGNLLKSLKLKAKRGLSVVVSDDARYATILEAGSIGGGVASERNKTSRKGNKYKVLEASTKRVMLPRPFLSTALDDKREDITKRLIEAINSGIDLKTMAKARQNK